MFKVGDIVRLKPLEVILSEFNGDVLNDGTVVYEISELGYMNEFTIKIEYFDYDFIVRSVFDDESYFEIRSENTPLLGKYWHVFELVDDDAFDCGDISLLI